MTHPQNTTALSRDFHNRYTACLTSRQLATYDPIVPSQFRNERLLSLDACLSIDWNEHRFGD